MGQTLRVRKLLPLLLLAACADLKTAPSDADGGAPSSTSSSSSSSSGGSSGTTPGGGSSSSGATGGSSGTLSGGTGPGPHGSLPNGYCCTKNEECRWRNCADVGGVKMCLDTCRHQETCTGKGLPSGFTCDAASVYDDGSCRPPAGFACLDPGTFSRGGKLTGECCTATGDGSAGLECEGALCITYSRSSNDNPFVCSNACESGSDCAKGFTCEVTLGMCVPGNDPYVCE